MDATIIRRQIIYFNVNAFIPATVFSISHIFSCNKFSAVKINNRRIIKKLLLSRAAFRVGEIASKAVLLVIEAKAVVSKLEAKGDASSVPERSKSRGKTKRKPAAKL